MANQKSEANPDDANHEGERTIQPRSAAEWTTLIGSLVVVSLLIGTALYEHFGRDEPAGTWLSVAVATDRAERRGDAYYVPFTASNDGSKPAEDVTIIFTIKDGEETVEESTVLVPFLPNSGSADGELITSFDPATYQIEARPATLLSP